MCENEQLNKNNNPIDPFAISDSDTDEEEEVTENKENQEDYSVTTVQKLEQLHIEK